MWTYRQFDGVLLHDGEYVATGYSGFENGKNNPDMQGHMGLGPIPRGSYPIQVIVDGNGQAVDYEGQKAPSCVWHRLPATRCSGGMDS